MKSVYANVIVNGEWPIFLTDGTDVHRSFLWKSVNSVRIKKLNKIFIVQQCHDIHRGFTLGKLRRNCSLMKIMFERSVATNDKKNY
jgi:hypothetical protein